MVAWSESDGRVTRAFDEWCMTDRDIRAFLSFSLKASEATYSHLWEETSQEPAWDEGPELPDVFDARIGGLWPHDYDWMLMAAVVKDAVTAFDVYLEKTREEMLLSHGFTASNYTDTRALTWDEVTNFFKRAIDVQLKGHQELRNVRDLRHILTHKRGELRTTEDRERFGKDDAGWIGYQVELTEVSTSQHLDVLAKHVRRVDVAAYPVAHAGKAPAGFAALLPGRRA